jgi:sec-independent protein translocase protein TatC
VALLRRGRASNFERAADGSMTLFEHLRELRSRLFKASLGVLVGAIAGYLVSTRVIDYLKKPYCDYQTVHNAALACTFVANGGPLDGFLLQLKVAMYVGLVLGAPIWLYQLWAFIAPGLHRKERRYTYVFVAIAAPLFAAGVVLAHVVVNKSLHLFLGSAGLSFFVSLDGYFGFVTKMMLLFGAAFEFPLLIAMLNAVGLVSGKRLLGWWRPAVFLMFLFGAIVTPTPDPFSMSILAGCMAILYFGAVAFALINDKRRHRADAYGALDDDEVSELDDQNTGVAIGAGAAIAPPEPIARPLPLESRFDDFT